MNKAPETLWYCVVCGKVDHCNTEEALASPEYVPHRGVDIRTCKGTFVRYVRDFMEG